MKSKHTPHGPAMTAILALLALALQSVPGFAQGELAPPGAPGPTMKTLAQIEPRWPISSATNLTRPGSYYLTTNINVSIGDGIAITTNDVTLDLNGFTISSTEPTASFGSGITIGNRASDVTIRNGHIRGGVTNNAGVFGGGGFAYGINDGGGQEYNIHVVDVSVSGCLHSGIYLGPNNGSLVESCTVRTAGGYGIFAQSVLRSSAYECGSSAISAGLATDCYGQSVGANDAVYALSLNRCYGYNAGSGIGAHGQMATSCYGYSSTGTGLVAYIASACEGVSGSSTNQIISFKYNMP